MLISLQVRDFVIVEKIDIDFNSGMTVLTGETGAGKSILVDALGLVLGERGNSQIVRNGAKRADFAAEFDISSLNHAKSWLEENALDADNECFLRRVINSDGRSRAFINGNPVSILQLKTLSKMLIDIHGQHFHQSLGRASVQMDLLDYFGDLLSVREEVSHSFSAWAELDKRLKRMQHESKDRSSRLELIEFQIKELDSLSLVEGEYDELNQERRLLKNVGRIAEKTSLTLNTLVDEEQSNINDLIATARRSLEALLELDDSIEPLIAMLETANIQITEIAETLRRYSENINLDPHRHNWVEERLDALQGAARKYNISAEELNPYLVKLRNEYDELSNAKEISQELELKAEKKHEEFLGKANKLSKMRHKAAEDLSISVTKIMNGLGMPGGKFEISIVELSEDSANQLGINNIEFLISANPGQKPLPLAKIASGGELSRMSLAIQVIASNGSNIPTMVFDEVDSGVGGSVAEIVGRRLQEIGESRQVLCVTHLPQVASLANNHFKIKKESDGKTTKTLIEKLNKNDRIKELARMLGGIEITTKTIDHAAEMLSGSKRENS